MEREHKAPVEVALSCQGIVMYICLLFVLFQALYPPTASTEWKASGDVEVPRSLNSSSNILTT